MKNTIKFILLLSAGFFFIGEKSLQAQSVLFSQNFEGTATAYTNGVVLQGGTPATVPAVQTWGSNTSFDNGYVLHRDDYQGAWAHNVDNCGSAFEPFPTCAANGSTYSAIFDNTDVSSYTSGNIISPPIDLSAANCGTSFSFYYFIGDCNSTSHESSLTLQLYNGSSYSTVWSDHTGCTDGWVPVTITIPGAYFISNFQFQFIATAGAAIIDNYPVGIDEISIQSPAALSASANAKNISCNGGTDGADTASVTGGTSPYTYLWNDAGSQTNMVATGLTPGAYAVTVTDNSGCSVTAASTLTQPGILSTNAAVVNNVTCNGAANGTAIANPSGGTTPYTYTWEDINSTIIATSQSTPSTLDIGGYTVTVQDSCGASVTASVIITQPSILRDSITAITNLGCNPGIHGYAAVGVKGGTLPYTYLWTSGSTLSSAPGLSGGTYTVNITDGNGCTGSASATISQPIAIRDSVASIAYPLCHGLTGSAKIGELGGTAPYTYVWSGGFSSTDTASNLPAGTYTVNVRDLYNCPNAAVIFTITQPGALRDSIVSLTNVSCNGASTGSATIGVTYGTSPYSYAWTPNVSSTSTATGLSAGTYFVAITDNNNCVATTKTVTVTEPQALRDSILVLANNNCPQSAYGTIELGAAYGTRPYNYTWTPNVSSSFYASGLSNGTYTLTVTDNCGVSLSASATITSPAALRDSVVSLTNPLCNGDLTGSVTLGVKGGVEPYTFAWSPNVSTQATATNIGASAYLVVITDNNLCSTILNVSVTQPTALSVVSQSTESGSRCNGTATVYASGGVLPYTYLWDGGQTTDTIVNKCPGSYCCTVTDSNGCSKTTCVTIHSTTGIENISGSSSLNIYPDPNNGQFTVTGVVRGQIIEIYDYTGRLISTVAASNETMQFNLSTQANGIYLVRIHNTDGSLFAEKKILKIN